MRKYFIAVLAVTLWSLFSFAYLGREDGSSGLSVLGWIHAIFFMPGLFLLLIFKASYSNQDLPAIAAYSWLAYTAVVLLGVKFARVIQGIFKGVKPKQGLQEDSEIHAD